jgi:hypothetical protein
MESYSVFPDKPINNIGPVARQFLRLGIHRFQEACRYVHGLPYGYNSNRDDLMILFTENYGSCTTKHAVIATLAVELQLAIEKCIGIYAMIEDLVTGTETILQTYELPYVPMVHCFLVYKDFRVDLSEGNRNGKNAHIEHFLHTEKVIADISAKDEYLLYRKALKDNILLRPEMRGIELTRILKAREDGLALLRKNIE